MRFLAPVLKRSQFVSAAASVMAVPFLLCPGTPASAQIRVPTGSPYPGSYNLYFLGPTTFGGYEPDADAIVGRGYDLNAQAAYDISEAYKVTFTDGTFLGYSLDYLGLIVRNNATAEQTGGYISGVQVRENGVFNSIGNARTGGFTAYDSSTVYVDSTSGGIGATLFNNSTATIVRGGVGGATYDNSVINVLQGTAFVDGGLHSYGNSAVNIANNGGGNVTAHENSRVNISGGRTFGTVANGSSEIYMTGGSSDYLTLSESARFDLLSGSVGNFDAFGDSITNVYGGAIGANFRVRGNALLNILGGTVSSQTFYGALSASENSRITISGGNIYTINATGNSSLLISGGNIQTTYFSGIPTSFLARTSQTARYDFVGTNIGFSLRNSGSYGGVSGFFWNVRWDLLDGTSQNFIYFDGGTGAGTQAPGGIFVTAAAAPEPSALALLLPALVGGVATRRRRRATVK